MKKIISTEATPTNIAKVIELLTDTPGQLEQLSQRYSPDKLRQPAARGERSPVEMLAHLLHCESRSSEAIYLALLTHEPLMVDVHPERQLGKLLRYDLLAFADLVVYFKLRRTVLLRILNSLTEAQWSRSIREARKQRQESVYWQARGQALHELEHLSDLHHKLNGSTPDD